jgi:activating signal cointegrator complex subunit 3
MITNVTEGIQWLKKSFFYRRVLKNPLVYGFTYAQLQDDRGGHMLMYNIIMERVQNLNRMRLIRYNANGEQVNSTDMGRVASNYYINCETMGYFMANCLPNLTEERIMYHMAHATEFKQLDARKDEMEELKYLIGDLTLFEIDKNSYNESYAKVLILFECYLKQRTLKTFSLFSDMTYIIQNGARLLRAMFEIALRNGYADLAKLTLQWCQIPEKRVPPNTPPLR